MARAVDESFVVPLDIEYVNSFCEVLVGYGPSQRVGNTVRNIRLCGKVGFTDNSAYDGSFTPTATPLHITCAIVHDLAAVAPPPLVEDIFRAVDANGSQSVVPYCGLNLNNSGRFTCLWRRDFNASFTNSLDGRDIGTAPTWNGNILGLAPPGWNGTSTAIYREVGNGFSIRQPIDVEVDLENLPLSFFSASACTSGCFRFVCFTKGTSFAEESIPISLVCTFRLIFDVDVSGEDVRIDLSKREESGKRKFRNE